MDTQKNDNPMPGNIPQSAEAFRTVPQPSEDFGNVPNDSETFRTLPNDTEDFRKVRNGSARTESHTLTVREVAKMFEQAGVPRTERSVVNWCQLNRQGVARLDAFFDENEGRYYITPQSVSRAIEEERARASANNQPLSAPQNPLPKQEQTPPSETTRRNDKEPSEADTQELSDLRRKVMDLEITNRVKEQLLTRLNDELIRKDEERRAYIERLISDSRRIGELESQLLQIGAPVQTTSLPKPTETFRTQPNDAQIHDAGHYPQGGVAL
jgi:hypothetical protein